VVAHVALAFLAEVDDRVLGEDVDDRGSVLLVDRLEVAGLQHTNALHSDQGLNGTGLRPIAGLRRLSSARQQPLPSCRRLLIRVDSSHWWPSLYAVWTRLGDDLASEQAPRPPGAD